MIFNRLEGGNETEFDVSYKKSSIADHALQYPVG